MCIRDRFQDLKIESKIYDEANNFKYFGSVIDNKARTKNAIMETLERIQARSRAYFAIMRILRSKILTRP